MTRTEHMKDHIYIDTKGSCVEHSTDAPVFAVKYGEAGFFPVYTRRTAAELNEADVTPEIQESAICGSMFGWTTPGARDAVRCILSREKVEA